MNIIARNIDITESMEDFIEDKLDFINEFSTKEVSLYLTSTKNEIDFKLVFDVNEKGCITKIKDVDFKKGIKRLRHDTYKKIGNIVHKKINKDTIRKMKPILAFENKNDKDDKNDNIEHFEIQSLEKPMTELDAIDIMLEERLNHILFTNIDCENCLTIIHRKKEKFKVYNTDIII